MQYGNISPAGKKLNWDDDLHNIPLGDSRDRLDMVYPDGDISVIESRRELTLINRTLPPGTNKCIGSCPDIENNAEILAIYNSNNQHCIIRFYHDNTFQNISYAKSAWAFQSDKPVTMFTIGTGDDTMLFMNDGVNPQRLVNIKNLADGKYSSLQASEINLIKPSPQKKPTLTLYSNINIATNNIWGKLFQFAFINVFDTGQKSLLGHYSDIVYDYRNETIAGDYEFTNTVNNCIIVGLERDYSNIEKLELYVRVVDIGSGALGGWVLYDVIEMSGDTADYYFYNDKMGTAPVESVDYIYEEIPLTSQVSCLADNRIILGQNNVNYDNVDIDIDLFSFHYKRVANPGGIAYRSGDPYISSTTMDIYYAGGNTLASIYVVLCKVINTGNIIDSYRKFYYLHKASVTSNAAIVSFFAGAITEDTAWAGVTASVLTTGGSPHRLQINNTGYSTHTIYAYAFTAPILTKSLILKTRCTEKLAICYYDSYNRQGRALIKDLSVVMPRYPATYNGYVHNYITFVINHLPPSWAVCYRFMYGTNGISSHFTIPVLLYPTFTDTADFVDDGLYFRLDIDAALNRCYDINESSNFNVFDVRKGDRMRIVGRISGTLNESDTWKYQYYGTEDIDVTVLGVDDDGKILLPSLKKYTSIFNVFLQFYPIYYFQFYRPIQNTGEDNLVYHEIGDIMDITGGYHMVNTSYSPPVESGSISINNQSEGVPARGVLNFGDTYNLYYHFGSLFVHLGSTEYRLIPIWGNVESVSSSFAYNSRALPFGRVNTYNADQRNETLHTLVYGEKYQNADLKYNTVNRFITQPVYMDIKNGVITGLSIKGDTLRAYQEKKITVYYLNKDEVTYADGSRALITGNNFLSAKNELPYDVGCSHINSMAGTLYADYFYDYRTSAWYRFSQDGLLNITEPHETNLNAFKMKAYGIYLSKLVASAIKAGDTYYIRSAFDPVKNLYIFTYINSTNPSQSVTLGFHEPTNSWLSFYSFANEWYFGMNDNRFFSLDMGRVYEHHISSIRVSTGYIKLHFHTGNINIFRNIELDSDQVWSPSSEWDITINDDMGAVQNYDSYEWNAPKMASLLKEIHFKNYDTKYIAWFLRNVLNKKGVSVGKIGLVNGELLRGKVINITLRNTKLTANILRAVKIGFENTV